MTEKLRPTIGIHTLRDSKPESIARFLDNGRLLKDLNDQGNDVVITDLNTFDTQAVRVPTIGKDGEIILTNSTFDASELDAMHVHPLGAVPRPLVAGVLKLNPDSLKLLAGSKIELYRQVLSEYQVQTEFLSMEPGTFAAMSQVIDLIDSDQVIVKSNTGNGGSSTKSFSKAEALQWVASELEKDEPKAQIIQPKINFGRLPDEVRATGSDEDKALVERAREEGLLTEIRSYALKRGEDIEVTRPILRVVSDKALSMSGSNDRYVEIELSDEMVALLEEVSREITEKATTVANSGPYALGAMDYYFDEFGVLRLMEANFRSAGLPVTEKYPITGRLVHASLAKTLTHMAQNKGDA